MVRSAAGPCLAASHQPEAQRPEKPVLMSMLKECMHGSMSCRSVEWRNVCFMLDLHVSVRLSFACGHRFRIDSCGWILRVDGWLPIFAERRATAKKTRKSLARCEESPTNYLTPPISFLSLASKPFCYILCPIKQITHRPHAQRPIHHAAITHHYHQYNCSRPLLNPYPRFAPPFNCRSLLAIGRVSCYRFEIKIAAPISY
jgi:hypothetical protein